MQDAGQQALGGGMFAGLMGVYCCTLLVFYVYFSMCIMKIAQKLGVENAWLAWIPIINIWILVQCAGKEWWWILLCFIPIANIIAVIVIWMAIAERRGKPSWLGILMIVPLANLIVPGYLAFTD
jgi:hypothetical protein